MQVRRTTIRVWLSLRIADFVGREREARAASGCLIAALPDGPRAITVRGEPGIGKTMSGALASRTAQRAATLLSARCVEGELPLALVGLCDLVGEAFADTADELADHDRAVLGVALGLTAPEQPARQRARASASPS